MSWLTKILCGAKTAKSAPCNAQGDMLCIDYPLEGEVFCCGHYSFRISAAGRAQNVKVSISEGPWYNCRRASGYWWYDWFAPNAGKFTLKASAFINGEEVETAPRSFEVIK